MEAALNYIDLLDGILQSGAGLTINYGSQIEMLRLARTARANGSKLTIMGVSGNEDTLEIARAGGNAVTFDVAVYKVRT